MTKVIKHIRGRDYYYYQTSLGIGLKPVTTYICPMRCSVIELSERSISSLVKHMIDLFANNALLNHVDYTFQNPPSIDCNNMMLEYIRACSKLIRENLTEEYRDIEQVVFAKYVHGSNL